MQTNLFFLYENENLIGIGTSTNNFHKELERIRKNYTNTILIKIPFDVLIDQLLYFPKEEL